MYEKTPLRWYKNQRRGALHHTTSFTIIKIRINVFLYKSICHSLFGLKNSYVNYYYSESSDGLYWNNIKSERFIEEIIGQAKSTKTYIEEFDTIIRMAFELSLKFILQARNFEVA